jgi:hypothetical protein
MALTRTFDLGAPYFSPLTTRLLISCLQTLRVPVAAQVACHFQFDLPPGIGASQLF